MSYLDRMVAEHDQDIDDIYVELRKLNRDKQDRYSPYYYRWYEQYGHLYENGLYQSPRRRTPYVDNLIKLRELEWADKQKKLDRLKSQALRAEYV